MTSEDGTSGGNEGMRAATEGSGDGRGVSAAFSAYDGNVSILKCGSGDLSTSTIFTCMEVDGEGKSCSVRGTGEGR